MHSETMAAELVSGATEAATTFRRWLIFAGGALLLIGAAAIVHDVTATRISVMVIGALLSVAGVVQIVHGFYVSSWSGFFLYLLAGIIRTAVGVMLVRYPLVGAEALTLVVSLYLIVGGVFKAVASFVLTLPGWGWTVASGVVSLALGVVLGVQWPQTSVWFVGFAVGLDLMLDGGALLMFAAAIKTLAPSSSSQS